MRKRWEQWRTSVREFERFVLHDIWRLGAPGEQVPHGVVAKQLRVLILLGTKLFDGNHMLRASSLAFATILSVVPFLAIMLIMIQMFSLEESLFGSTRDFIEGTGERVSNVFTDDDEEDALSTGEPVESEAAPETEFEAPAAEPPSPETTGAAPEPEATDGGSNPPADPEESESELLQAIRELAFQGVGQTQDGEQLVNPVDFVFSTAENIVNNPDRPSGAVLGLSGFVLVLTTVFGLMRNLEMSFNRIWGVREGRPWVRKTADYFVITLLLPFVTAAALGAMAALQSDSISDLLGPFSYGLRFVQHLLIVLLFSLLYKLIPNATVYWRYALLAGFVAGTAWILLSWSYVQFQFGLSRQQEVLGSLAMFPLFLMWIYLSWAVLLFGAELAFAYQNESTFALERSAEEASPAYREALGVRVMIDIARRFAAGEPPLVREHAAHEWNVPPSLLSEAIEALKDAGYIVECASQPIAYQPARPLDKITAGQVIDVLRKTGAEPSELRRDPFVRETLRIAREQPDISLNDLIGRVQPAEPDGDDA